MFDQAEALRALARGKGLLNEQVERPRVFTLAVTSGKGGVGKTSIAVNIALLLSRSGRTVRIIDADLGLSNAEVLLGVSPKSNLHDVLKGKVDPRDAWIDAIGGIKLLSSGSGLEEMANMDDAENTLLIDRVIRTASDGDVIIIDTAPGINKTVTSFLNFADEVMVVTTPEPTSITDAYAAIKVLISNNPEADISLVANCCSSPGQATAVADGLDSICRRFLERSFNRYEYLPNDPAVSWAVRNQRPLALSSTQSMVTAWLRKTAIKLDARIKSRLIDTYNESISNKKELVVAG